MVHEPVTNALGLPKHALLRESEPLGNRPAALVLNASSNFNAVEFPDAEGVVHKSGGRPRDGAVALRLCGDPVDPVPDTAQQMLPVEPVITEHADDRISFDGRDGKPLVLSELLAAGG